MVLIDARITSEPNPTNNSLYPYIKEFEAQHAIPPGGDLHIRACYEAVLRMVDKNTTIMKSLLEQVVSERGIRPQHLVNLFLRSVQYIELFQRRNPKYPSEFLDSMVWEEELTNILKQNGQLLHEILLTKDTTTTIYERYAGSKIVLNALYPRKDLTVIDFGCGGNYGLPGLAKGTEFKPIEDKTTGEFLNQMLQLPLKIERGLAIDKWDPYDASSKEWRMACSAYPQELSQEYFDRHNALDQASKSAENVQFLQADLLDLEELFANRMIPQHTADAVIMSTMCYQLTPDEQTSIIKNAQRIIRPDGVIIVQDFATKDPINPHRLKFGDKVTFSEEYAYRTFIMGEYTNWQMREVIRWYNGRCRKAEAGEDYHFLNHLDR